MKKTVSILFTFIIALLYVLFEEDITSKKLSTADYNEKYYQTKMCNALGGEMEVVLEDKARIDCLTSEYAIEVDFAKKWAEGIGQSLYYAQMSGKKPAVGLISGADDKKFIYRLESVAKKYNIKVIIIDAE
ncbi:MAG TPA: hypothetical protein CFH84_11745 [Sulfurimonas sp. UBA12504]|nr:MAG: hypothetical protein A2019_08870 [Sulfurimonas sp. GWF2_37_8]DAB29017.1 MAG TPA: hypothetical protein CFH84_11745 [Sulfurimonas sp. UBA12504]